MESTTRLCDAILPHLQDRSVADVVFSRSSGGSTQNEASPSGGISDEQALKHYKGELRKASAAARATRSAAVLEKFSKDPRISIRRIVAASPHLGPETAEYLHAWALKKNDHELLEAVLPRTPWRTALAAVTPELRYHPWTQLAESLAAPGTKEPFEAAKAIQCQPLWFALVEKVVSSPPEGYSLTEFLAGMEPQVRAGLLQTASREVKTLTAEFATLVDGHAEIFLSQDVSGVATRPTRRPRHMRHNRLLPSVERVEKDAVPIILNSSLESLWVALSGTPVPPTVVHRLLEKGSTDVAESFARQKHRSLTTLMVERMAPAIAAGGQAWAVKALLSSSTAKLSTETLLLLLRSGSLESTMEWLRGKLPRRPLPGEVKSLVDDPQNAFTHGSAYHYLRNGPENTPLAEVASRLSGHLDAIVKLPWGTETVDALKGEFFSLIVGNSYRYNTTELSAYLSDRLERAFGSNSMLWETALTLAGSWGSGLTDLIEAAFLATGETPPSMERLIPIIPDPPVSLGQMTLEI